jgi:hypothetical protein
VLRARPSTQRPGFPGEPRGDLGDAEPARPEQFVILGEQLVVSPDPQGTGALAPLGAHRDTEDVGRRLSV